MVRNTPAQRKIISFLKKRNPNLQEKELIQLLDSIKRFVKLTQRIYTEPQAQVTIRDRNENGKIIKDQIFNTTPEELEKVRENPSETMIDLIRKTHKKVTKKKYD